VEHYIVRIYRRGENAPDDIAGTADVIETGQTKTFKNSEDLIRILNPGGESDAAKRKKNRPEDLSARKRNIGNSRKGKK